MWSKAKAFLKKPLVLGLSVGVVLIILAVLFRRRVFVTKPKAVVDGLIAQADQIIPAI
ncbi:MAG: hypothetical protein PHN88_16215 [Ignavibacteria bacterium]|nr:hypothetical protein [Ignavibacteria bacterium]